MSLKKGLNKEEKEGIDRLRYRKSLMFHYIWGGGHLFLAFFVTNLFLILNWESKFWKAPEFIIMWVAVSFLLGVFLVWATQKMRDRLNQRGLYLSVLWFVLAPLILAFIKGPISFLLFSN